MSSTVSTAAKHTTADQPLRVCKCKLYRKLALQYKLKIRKLRRKLERQYDDLTDQLQDERNEHQQELSELQDLLTQAEEDEEVTCEKNKELETRLAAAEEKNEKLEKRLAAAHDVIAALHEKIARLTLA